MYYFASDMHLGLDRGGSSSRERERLLVRWLDEIRTDAAAIFLVGDVFDFWFEYKRVAPRGHVRLLGKLAELADRGVEVHFFTGNHDMWTRGYLAEETGITVHDRGGVFELAGRRVFIAHGDNLWFKKPAVERSVGALGRSRVARGVFSAVVHPDLALRLGQWWSRRRRSRTQPHDFCGESEHLVRWARRYRERTGVDLFVFGHLHCAADHDLGDGGRVVVLGEWIDEPTYAVMGGDGKIELKKYG